MTSLSCGRMIRLHARHFPPPPPLLFLSAKCLSFSVFLCVAGTAYGRSWNSERDSMRSCAVKSLFKTGFRSHQRDQSYWLSYLLWQKLVFALQIGDHIFLNFNSGVGEGRLTWAWASMNYLILSSLHCCVLTIALRWRGITHHTCICTVFVRNNIFRLQ